MSHKAPKNYNKGAQKASKTTATAEEERQAKRVIGGIVIGLVAILAVTLLTYHFVLS